MHTSIIILLAALIASTPVVAKTEGLEITFKSDANYSFSQEEQRLIEEITVNTANEIRTLLPNLPPNISIIVIPVADDLDAYGGVTGMASKPQEVEAAISYRYPGGVTTAIDTALASHYYHEFHHLARGWTVEGNKFERGIDIAAVNEGLAEAFTKIYTEVSFEIMDLPPDINEWVEEILLLPKDADYRLWMNQHPDGRVAIGYRAGTYIVEQAMQHSGKNIIELSKLSPRAIIKLAKY